MRSKKFSWRSSLQKFENFRKIHENHRYFLSIFVNCFFDFSLKKCTILKDFHGFSRNSTDSEILVLDDQASDSTKSKCSVKYGRCTFTRYAVLRVFRNVFASTRRHQHAYKTGISYARSHPWASYFKGIVQIFSHKNAIIFLKIGSRVWNLG